MRKYLFSIIYLLSITSLFYSQYKNIRVNSKYNSPNEVSISINPHNPLNLIAGANLDNYYYSFDGGSTWNEGTIESSESGVWGDPCVVFDKKGNACYFHLAKPSVTKWLDRIVCQVSADGGMSWSDPGSYVGKNPPKIQDKDWACSDWKRNGYVYLAWTQFDRYRSKDPDHHSNIMFSRSTDRGFTWNDARQINSTFGDCLDSSNTDEGAVPCVGPNGEVYVSWSGPAGIVFNVSHTAGSTWLDKEIPVAQQYGGWEYDIPGLYRCNGMPVTACDISNDAYRGTIYINFSDRRNGTDDVDIFLVKSTDGGNTWSDVKRVNDDSVGNKKQQFMSWMSVDPITGAVNILFYDRRNYKDLQTDVYLARSTDGGETFENIKISEEPFIPEKKTFFGDYIGISSYNDFVACIWQRLDRETLSIMFTGVDFKQNK
ncbi:MAG: sialidase family protein [Ignavibacteria bacterium]|jgi:hypothetical protein